MKTRCCCPPESAPIWTGAKRRMRTCVERGQRILAIPIGDGQEPAGAKRAAHQGHVEHADRELPVDVRPLWHVGDAGTWPVDRLTVEEDLTMRRRQDPVQAFQQRALAGAIGADERGRLTRSGNRG